MEGTFDMYKVVVTDHIFRDLQQEESILRHIDAEVFGYQCKNRDEAIRVTRDADAIITNNFKSFDRAIIDSLDRCKVIVRYGIGVDTIDIGAATRKGIMVVNVPEYCIDEVSDHAVAFTLALSRNIFFSNQAIKDAFDYRVDFSKPVKSLRASTVGIIGLGKIGKRTAKKLSGFTHEIIFYDPFVLNDYSEDNLLIRKSSLDDLLATSDYIILNAPLTRDNYHVIDASAFSKMNQRPYIINVSRGELVDSDALATNIEKGSIKGAALDVVEGWPPINQDSPLLKCDKILLTPHSAWYSEEALLKLQKTVAEEVLRVLTGQLPHSLVNKEMLSR